MRVFRRSLLFVSLLFLPLLSLTGESVSGSLMTNKGEGTLELVVRQVFEQELDWRFSSNDEKGDLPVVLISDLSFDEETFRGKTLFKARLTITTGSAIHEEPIALLLGEDQDIETALQDEIRQMVRLRSNRWFSPLSQRTITYALPSGYWVLSDDPSFRVGWSVTVVDADDRPLALMRVVDRFTYELDTVDPVIVVELLPLWISRPIIPGMPINSVKRGWDISVSPWLSPDRAGGAIRIDVPLGNSLMRLPVQVDAGMALSSRAYEVMVSAGISRKASLGELFNSHGLVKRWWANIQVGVDAMIGFGLGFPPDGSLSYLYGAQAQAQVLHQAFSGWYWGVGIGYRHRVSYESGTFSSIQENGGVITVSPTCGWVW